MMDSRAVVEVDSQRFTEWRRGLREREDSRMTPRFFLCCCSLFSHSVVSDSL